jgi:hypothetical protein
MGHRVWFKRCPIQKVGFVKRIKPSNLLPEFVAAPNALGSKRNREPAREPIAKPTPSTGQLDSRTRFNRPEPPQTLSEAKRLYLRVGDEVTHVRYEEWGMGVVMEIMTSSVPGGTCLARIRFQDGQLRCFNNDLDNESCCYYFGVRRYWNPSHGVNAVRSKFFLRG